MAVAFIFPGQGSQFVGMGQELCKHFPAARAVFDEVNEALGEKLTDIMWNGPSEKLTLTRNAQPALMAVSMAVIRTVEQAKFADWTLYVKFVAGHSLGEYSALTAAGALRLSDAARLLRTRGEAMQTAVATGEGAMAAMLGIQLNDAYKLAAAAAQGEVCETANDNAPGQVVLSGTRTAVERAVSMAKDYGARRAVLLNVSAPFHCALMAPAAEAMKSALSDVPIRKSRLPVVANVLAKPISEPDEIRQRLIEQVTGTVRWRESIRTMADGGVDTFYEVGAGKVLSGLVRQTDRSLSASTLGSVEEVNKYATS